MRKRLASSGVLLCLVAVLAACGESSPPPAPPPPAPEPAPQPPPAPEPVPVPEPPPTACRATENRALPVRRALATAVPRIVGGREAMPGAYQWMLAIGYQTGSGVFHYCGGTLIKDRWVLTAAHCQVLPGDIVTIGRHNLVEEEDGVQVRVKRGLSHADYNAATNANDISVVELEQALLAPHAVELGAAPQEGTVRALGWGRTSEGGPTSNVLMQVDLPIITNAQCNAIYGDIAATQMCAGIAGRDSCQGDSGGPLLFEGRQAGITSYGVGCARPEWPGVYTRTADYVDWIEACTR